MFSEYEEYILMRIRNVCKGGVDAVVDFVSSARTVQRSASVLKEVRGRIQALSVVKSFFIGKRNKSNRLYVCSVSSDNVVIAACFFALK